MASRADDRGKSLTVSPEAVQTAMARALGREMRAQGQTNEKLEALCGVPDRRIEKYRSFTEDAPVYLEDFLSIASVLGPRFVTGILSEINMYAAEFNGVSPEKIGAEIAALAAKLAGGDGK